MKPQIRSFGLVLLLTLMTPAAFCGDTEDITAPMRVMNQYLSSLVNGDTQTLAQLIDGRMKQNNRQLFLSPNSYPQFLREHYAGVQTKIENIVREGNRVRAKVRFNYSSQDSSLIEFILVENSGVWKIIDEVY